MVVVKNGFWTVEGDELLREKQRAGRNRSWSDHVVEYDGDRITDDLESLGGSTEPPTQGSSCSSDTDGESNGTVCLEEELEVLSDDEDTCPRWADEPDSEDCSTAQDGTSCPPGLWLQGQSVCVMLPVQFQPQAAPELIQRRHRGVRGGRRKNKQRKAQVV